MAGREKEIEKERAGELDYLRSSAQEGEINNAVNEHSTTFTDISKSLL